MLTAGNVDHSSSRIRAVQFIPYLEKNNFKVTWIPRVGLEPFKKLDRLLFPFLKRYFYLKTRVALLFGNWDIVFVQRAFIEKFYLKQIAKRGIKLIYDFDDAIYLNENKNSTNLFSASIMVKHSDAVIVSTSVLVSFCESKGKKPSIIPTSVDGDLIKPLQIQIQKETLTVGWIGSKWTTPFLKEAEEGLRLLTKDVNFKLLLVGADQNYKPEEINFVHLTWSMGQEADYLKLMDIGIMPLPDTEFAKGKGGFKLYLYMATGIPVVASPVGINSEIVKEEVNGFLASNTVEWKDTLYRLLADEHLRKKMGYEGRQLFEKNYSNEMAFEKLNQIISNL